MTIDRDWGKNENGSWLTVRELRGEGERKSVVAYRKREREKEKEREKGDGSDADEKWKK